MEPRNTNQIRNSSLGLLDRIELLDTAVTFQSFMLTHAVENTLFRKWSTVSGSGWVWYDLIYRFVCKGIWVDENDTHQFHIFQHSTLKYQFKTRITKTARHVMVKVFDGAHKHTRKLPSRRYMQWFCNILFAINLLTIKIICIRNRFLYQTITVRTDRERYKNESHVAYKSAKSGSTNIATYKQILVKKYQLVPKFLSISYQHTCVCITESQRILTIGDVTQCRIYIHWCLLLMERGVKSVWEVMKGTDKMSSEQKLQCAMDCIRGLQKLHLHKFCIFCSRGFKNCRDVQTKQCTFTINIKYSWYHRDFKPSNAIMTLGNDTELLIFGSVGLWPRLLILSVLRVFYEPMPF